jgi:hypothetical protein
MGLGATCHHYFFFGQPTLIIFMTVIRKVQVRMELKGGKKKHTQ